MTQTQTNDIYGSTPLLLCWLMKWKPNMKMSNIRIFSPVLLLFGLCVCVTSVSIIIIWESLCVAKVGDTTHSDKITIGKWKNFFSTHKMADIYIYTPDWHILRRLEFKKKLLPGENRRKCDFCRIKDGGSSRWRIAFQPISSDFFFSIQFFFSIRIFWRDDHWHTHTHTHTRWHTE